MITIKLTDAEGKLLDRWLDRRVTDMAWSSGTSSDESEAVKSLATKVRSAITDQEWGGTC